ncbi:anti-sigma factor [Methylobacterium brachythecii]|uniref:Anti-sigma-K factor RskA n=1 Tax=Methylobacterium brachythecii TaxID=1176177 RepID=A0A7W6F6D9_9HYPH|nr:anti-sigma factor [Methylobacterium brachythecii]MBB3902317.1 anti-sigma-K factor RskA [Methylobacterium brachythecii]GLS42165.1 DNA-directed RNA polymerase sigma-70 factor [Methylobacterium brachythecii]
MIPSEPEDRDVLAGEYVLGLLDSDATAEVERNLDSDADLARRVTFWEERLLPVSAALGTAEVHSDQWARIERDLATRRQALGRTSTLPPARPRPAIWSAAWRSPAVWRATTALATAAAIVLAILPNRVSAPAESPTRYFAILHSRDAAGQESGPGWLIQIAQNGTLRSLPLSDVTPGSGRSLQLWTLWDQARGPVSLGVLPPGGAIRLPPERLESIGDGQLFEITLEPEAGSPIGRPTGRILFIGRAKGAAMQSL